MGKKLLDAGDVFYWNNNRFLYLGYMCGTSCKIDSILVFNYTLEKFELKDPNIENIEFEVAGRIISAETEISAALLHLERIVDQGYSII